MKKVSTASFIIAIVLIVCAITLNILGFVNMNGFHVSRHYGDVFMKMTVMNTTSTSQTYTCLGMIIAGGFLFVGGILLFVLSALTCCREARKSCCHHEEVEKPEQCCCSKAEEPEQCCCNKAEEPEQN